MEKVIIENLLIPCLLIVFPALLVVCAVNITTFVLNELEVMCVKRNEKDKLNEWQKKRGL